MSAQAYVAVLGVVAVLRIFELVVSCRRIAALGGRSPAAGGSLDWAAMIAVHAALLLLPAVEVLVLHRRAPAWIAWPALALVVAAALLRHACIAALGRSWNARARVPEDLEVVASGPYRLCRHPNYLAILVEFVALPAAGGAWLSLVLLNLLHVPVLVRRIRSEERLLRAVPGYVEAMGGKPLLLPLGERRHPPPARSKGPTPGRTMPPR